MGFKENLAKIEPIDGLASIVVELSTGQNIVIPNEKGKQGSLAVYNHLIGPSESNTVELSRELAYEGLHLFGEYTIEAYDERTSHPNIQTLLGITEKKYTATATRFYE